MATFIIGFFTALLILLSLFVILLVLMQRPSANAGLGASLGGGAAESAFGGQTNEVLTKMTIYGTVAFFVISAGLYLSYMAKGKPAREHQTALPAIMSVEKSSSQEDLTALPGLADEE
tara:strand:- start:4043 stop:4396 length:354 start_codon:yes stop_codon:yes gene_type:complete